MYCGLKKVYFLFFVRKPRSSARLKSDMALFRKPACLASSRDMRVKISATAVTCTKLPSEPLQTALRRTELSSLGVQATDKQFVCRGCLKQCHEEPGFLKDAKNRGAAASEC